MTLNDEKLTLNTLLNCETVTCFTWLTVLLSTLWYLTWILEYLALQSIEQSVWYHSKGMICTEDISRILSPVLNDRILIEISFRVLLPFMLLASIMVHESKRIFAMKYPGSSFGRGSTTSPMATMMVKRRQHLTPSTSSTTELPLSMSMSSVLQSMTRVLGRNPGDTSPQCLTETITDTWG